MIDLLIFTPALDLLGRVAGINDLSMTTCYNDLGTLRLTCTPTARNLSALVPGNLIAARKDRAIRESSCKRPAIWMPYGRIGTRYDGWVIRSVALEHEEDGDTLEVYAESVSGLLGNRVVYPVYAETTLSIPDHIQALVTAHVGSGATADRQMPTLRILPHTLTGYAAATKEETGHPRLDAVLRKYAQEAETGWAIVLEPKAHRYVFCQYAGRDRTGADVFAGRVRFDGDRLQTVTYEVDQSDYRNIAYVSGSATVRTVGAASGMSRRECWEDASSLDTQTNDALDARGAEVLAEHAQAEALSGEATPHCPAVFMADYGLGDLVRVQYDPFGVSMDVRVMSITEEINEQGYTITPTFGTPADSFVQRLNKRVREV